VIRERRGHLLTVSSPPQAGGAHVHDYALFKQAYFNLSHTVHSLSFGQQFPGIVNPLDGVTKVQTNAVSRLFQLSRLRVSGCHMF
jgi:hypothetical protein